MLRIFVVIAALFAAGSSPVVSQIRPGWTYAVVGEGGFGWSNPTTADHPIVVETIMRLNPGRQVGDVLAPWVQYTVSLDCSRQTATILNGRYSRADGVTVATIDAQPPTPLNDPGIGVAGRVLCNNAPFSAARTTSSLDEVVHALSGERSPTLPPLMMPSTVSPTSTQLRTLAPDEPLGHEVTRSFAMRPEVGVDFYGNDIGMVEVGPRDVAACSARCDADGRCRAFSLYTPAPGDKGFCWLKHSVGERRSVAEVTSGLRSSPSASAAQPGAQAALSEPWRCAGAARVIYGRASAGHSMMLTVVDPSGPRAIETGRRLAEAEAVASRMYPDIELTQAQQEIVMNSDAGADLDACIAAGLGR